MPPEGFEPTVPVSERPLTYALDRAATGIGKVIFFFLLALQPPLGVVFYSPLAGFSLFACEVS